MHNMLLEIGFEDFLAARRAAGDARVFPDFEQAKDDGSWSKQFSKHFKRFNKIAPTSRRDLKV